MAFMGRGDFPSIGDNNIEGIQDNDIGGGYYYYRPVDKTYVIMQMVATFIIIVIGIISFVATYKSTIIDPIESTKKLLINTYLIIIGILLAITLVTNFFVKSKTFLIKKLVIILAISIIIMLVFLGIKLNLDATYTEDKFEQFYTEQNIDESSKNTSKSKLDMVITETGIKTEKEYYIYECSKLYGIFSAKFYGIIRNASFT